MKNYIKKTRCRKGITAVLQKDLLQQISDDAILYGCTADSYVIPRPLGRGILFCNKQEKTNGLLLILVVRILDSCFMILDSSISPIFLISEF